MIVFALSARTRNAIAFVFDLLVAAGSWWLAFWLRYNLEDSREFLHAYLYTFPWVVGIHGVLFWRLGLYRGLWRYASLPDLRRILIATSIAAVATPAFFLLMAPTVPIPRSCFVMLPILTLLAMSGSRIAYRAWKEHGLTAVIRAPGASPAIVLGAGDAAAALLKELNTGREWHVVALLDPDERKHGSEIMGVKIAGGLERVNEFAAHFSALQAIIAMPSESHATRKRAVELCNSAGLHVMTVPSYSELVSGKVSLAHLRNVELDDLLGRDPVQLDEAGLRSFIEGKKILVTGAGGSIGSELCRQIAAYSPKSIIFFEQSEFALYTIASEFRDTLPNIECCAVLGDVRDDERVHEVFRKYRPELVFHAAAYKHVPLMEENNAWQGVRNNVLGTLTVARAARSTGVGKFILISTDKAVNPTNVMGTTKRLAEMVCQAVQIDPAEEFPTKFVIVRFGNVLGSTGSVIPRFREQISRGGPVTVTHPEIERYFMSIPEAAQLVLQAALMGNEGQIFVLDMGEPVKIVDLARSLIRLSGFSESDIRIVFTGLRPGEKLFEELLAGTEHTLTTPHAKLRIAKVRPPQSSHFLEEIVGWLNSTEDRSDNEVRARLRLWVAEYAPRDQPGTVLPGIDRPKT